MKLPGIGHVSVIVLIVIAIQNFIHISLGGLPKIYFLPNVVFMVLCAITIHILEKYFSEKKIHAIIFFLCAILTTLTGSEDNAVGVMFICFYLYLENARGNKIIIAMATIAVALTARVILQKYSAVSLVNHYILYAYIIFVYFKVMHPKPVKLKNIPELTESEKEIINLMAEGYTSKEIPDQLEERISAGAVRSAQKRIRDKMGVATNSQLMAELGKKRAFD